jgi:hypothetical protein
MIFNPSLLKLKDLRSAAVHRGVQAQSAPANCADNTVDWNGKQKLLVIAAGANFCRQAKNIFAILRQTSLATPPRARWNRACSCPSLVPIAF